MIVCIVDVGVKFLFDGMVWLCGPIYILIWRLGIPEISNYNMVALIFDDFIRDVLVLGKFI